MKKISIAIAATFLFFCCGLYKTVDLGKLTIGMTKEEVVFQIGQPRRVLSVNQINNNYQEVLEYKTYRGEVYALEFWNDYLTGYEFLYEDVVYTPAPAPPAILPDYGRPLHPNYPPPSKPTKPNRPSTKPNQPSRPERPGTNNQQERPNTNNNNRPERPNTSTRSDTRTRQETNSSETTRQRENSSEERPQTRENTNTNSGRR